MFISVQLSEMNGSCGKRLICWRFLGKCFSEYFVDLMLFFQIMLIFHSSEPGYSISIKLYADSLTKFFAILYDVCWLSKIHFLLLSGDSWLSSNKYLDIFLPKGIILFQIYLNEANFYVSEYLGE